MIGARKKNRNIRINSFTDNQLKCKYAYINIQSNYGPFPDLVGQHFPLNWKFMDANSFFHVCYWKKVMT